MLLLWFLVSAGGIGQCIAGWQLQGQVEITMRDTRQNARRVGYSHIQWDALHPNSATIYLPGSERIGGLHGFLPTA